MDEYVKWSVGPFWQQILGSNKQASFIKRAGEPLGRAFLLKTSEKKRQAIPVGPRHMAQFRCHRFSARLYALEPAGTLT